MHASFAISAILIAQTQPATVEATWPAELYASITGTHLDRNRSYSGWSGDGNASATWYLVRPLVDDEAPLAIQSYLQRLSNLHLSFGGGALAASGVSSYRYTSKSLHTSASGLFYLGNLILGAGAYYYHLGSDATGELHHTTHLFYPWLIVGARLNELELHGAYQNRTYYDDGAKRAATWGRASLRLQGVVQRLLFLRLDGYTITSGGGANLNTEMFFDPSLGVWLTAFFERGQIYTNSINEYSQHSEEIGIGWWASRRFELQFSLGYSSATRNGGGYPAVTTGIVSLGIVVRVPQRQRARAATDDMQSPSPAAPPLLDPTPAPAVEALAPAAPGQAPIPAPAPEPSVENDLQCLTGRPGWHP